MKKGFKECPFCANEIKEGAKKCQYCHEFLDKNLNNINKSQINSHDSKNINQSENRVHRPRYKNLGTYVIIAFLVLVAAYNINHKLEQKNAKNKMNSFYDSIVEQNGDVSNLDFNEFVNAGKTAFDNKYAQQAFEQLAVIGNKYNNKLNLIGELYIEENVDLKNESLLKEVISNWKAYKSATNEYNQDVKKLTKDIQDQFGESDKLKLVEVKIPELVNSINRYADVNIELYSYILSIQNDFYIDYDDEIIFYNGGDSMNKFNNLREKWEIESDIFDKAYDEFEEFMLDYAKSARNH